jgi:hypothetical protein
MFHGLYSTDHAEISAAPQKFFINPMETTPNVVKRFTKVVQMRRRAHSSSMDHLKNAVIPPKFYFVNRFKFLVAVLTAPIFVFAIRNVAPDVCNDSSSANFLALPVSGWECHFIFAIVAVIWLIITLNQFWLSRFCWLGLFQTREPKIINLHLHRAWANIRVSIIYARCGLRSSTVMFFSSVVAPNKNLYNDH